MKSEKAKILIVDDELSHRLLLRAILEDCGYEVNEAANGRRGLEMALGTDYNVMLLDIKMPEMDGLEVLKNLQTEGRDVPVVMLTAFGTVGSAVEAMKFGAFDYLTKPADNEEIKAVVAKAVRFSLLLDENKALRKAVQKNDGGIIGQSQGMQRVLELIDQAGPTEANVLISGESGTGKELVAQSLHDHSLRSAYPIIKINCAALPENLLESELFGYVKGAFTGALKDKPGRFQLAKQGSIFLDEIGEMPIHLQAKLLRALQERVIEPLGAVKPLKIDVRIIAATNRDLAREVENNRFREDLFYRLNVLELKIPPLRERRDDIPLLVSFFLEKLGEKNRKQVRSVSNGFLNALAEYYWPGNVRELENTLERAIILCRSDILELRDLPGHIIKAKEGAELRSVGNPASQPSNLELSEREAIVRALARHQGHRERTADYLGISRRTLQYKIKKYGLKTRS